MNNNQLTKLEGFMKEKGINVDGIVQGGKTIKVIGITEYIQ